MELTIDGQAVGYAYEPNFANNNHTRECIEFEAKCTRGVEDENTFPPSDYKTHCTIFAFDLTLDGERAQHLIKNIGKKHKFSYANAINKTLTLLVYAFHNDTVAFDFERNFMHTGDTII